MQQEPLVEKVCNFLARYDLYGKTFIVGFSGGFDSMCLMDILTGLNVKLVGAHFNHGWRTEADDEEVRCKEFCEARGVEFYSEHASKDLKKTETDARNARYEFFARAVEKFGADGIFTAHNFDDNAETVLYRIIKGTGIKGLQGISEHRGNIYRPILGCTRSEIEAYCVAKGLAPNVDCSNLDVKYKRNFIRHKVLPMMDEINPSAKLAINNLSEMARLNEEIIAEYLEGIISDVILDDRIDVPKFVSLSEAVQQRVVYEFLTNVLDEYDSRKVKEVREFVLANCEQKSDVRMSLTTDLWLAVNNRVALLCTPIVKSDETVCINGVGNYCFQGFEMLVEECLSLPEDFPRDEEGVAYVDFSGAEFPLTLRYGKSDDLIIPMGMQGSMLLKKYLSGRGVMKPLRNKVPVLLKGDNVLWVPYVGMSDVVKVELKPTHRLIFKKK